MANPARISVTSFTKEIFLINKYFIVKEIDHLEISVKEKKYFINIFLIFIRAKLLSSCMGINDNNQKKE